MRSRVLWPVVSTIAVVAVAGGYLALDAYDIVPGILTTKPVIGASETLVRPASVAPAAAVLPPAAQTTTINKQAVQAQVDTLVNTLAQPNDPNQPPPAQNAPAYVAPHISVEFLDAATGEEVAGHESEVAYTPASSTKITAIVAAMEKLGPDHTFTTKTALNGTTVSLIAGGDQLLGAGESNPLVTRGHAGLGTLAAQTAEKLKAQKVTSVAVALDDTVWGDESQSPDWLSQGMGQYAGRISPIAINTGLSNPQLTYGYVADPALSAATVFADALKAQGIAVSGVSRAKASPDAKPLASVESAPLADIARSLAKASDNVLAEGVCRAAALADGKPGTYDGSVAMVRDTVGALGVDMSTYQARDCSGLSEQGKISAGVLAHTLYTAIHGSDPKLASVAAALPVAGLDGTLHDRFLGKGSAGIVRAKTGSLSHARSLTGIMPTASGSILVYSVVVADYQEGQGGRVLDHIDRMIDGVAAL
ncbi:MAG: D-alanyl-D-alanine carboxypeptidase/D-alanyl-D-alanine-endopeptidase [Actinomycetaceae bacterium]|nr:D-alanyl-D-alanine carboxypeptidase/D-alanyl-D-alanine-endopeptidase [Actinomycetaceae bacterium]MDU0970552.1 D-alanyl-D-alanine carboxypeptidase/D-alanyl-D-alanine-endopeptidase [Actinomycetaceae bacterium]